MDLDRLIDGLDVQRVCAVTSPGGSARAVRICDITEDSRTVMPGSLFIARKGEKTDGRRFVAQAVEAGTAAVLTDDATLKVPMPAHGGEHAQLLIARDLPGAIAALGERFYGDPSASLNMIGVTGTNGKTTTTWIIHQILNGAAVRCGLIGTVVVDDGTEVAEASLTTPPALELSRTLSRMVEAGCKACAMEVSSHALHQKRVGSLKFRTGVFTNLTHDHLDYHGTMERYADTKAMLFASLPSAADGGVAIVNADDAAHKRMLRDCKAQVIECTMRSRQSPSDKAAWRATITGVTLAGTRCAMTTPAGAWDLLLPMIGAHNVMNAMQAAAAAHAAGIDADEIRARLEVCAAPPGRLEPVSTPADPFAVYVDYAHTDDALQRVLTVCRGVLNQQGKGRLLTVFGCGGDRDRTKRPKMGRAAASLADRAYVTSDNPRSEDPKAIIEQIIAGIEPRDRAKAIIESDRETAIRLAVRDAQAGDILVIAGKGHETYQIVPDGRGGTRKLDFDDRKVARAAMLERADVREAPIPGSPVVAPARTGALRAAAKPPASPRRHKPGPQDHHHG